MQSISSIRRAAHRQQLSLHKVRGQDVNCWYVVDDTLNAVIVGGGPVLGTTLEEAVEYIFEGTDAAQ